jgi:hypothetical protein
MNLLHEKFAKKNGQPKPLLLADELPDFGF